MEAIAGRVTHGQLTASLIDENSLAAVVLKCRK